VGVVLVPVARRHPEITRSVLCCTVYCGRLLYIDTWLMDAHNRISLHRS
jgi:hypothetical protein